MQNAPFVLLESQTIPITQEFLAIFLQFPPSPTERVRDPKRVTYLRAKYDAGLWGPCHWVTAAVDDTEYRLNGSHSSEMLRVLDGAMADNLVVHWDRWRCQSLNDLATLFRQIDDRKSARSLADVAGAYQGLEEDLRGTPRPPAKRAVEGINWFRRMVEKTPVDEGDDQYRVFHEKAEHPFIIWVSNDVFANRVPELDAPAILAAMYVTFLANEVEARAFWLKVAKGGDEYQEGAPDRVLADWLSAVKEREPGTTSIKIGPGQLYQGCLYAWNAHRRGDVSIKNIKVDKKPKAWTKASA